MRAIGSRRWRPRRTVRLRLTLLYGALFLVAGAALLAITYGLVANGTGNAAKPIFLGKQSGTSVALPAVPNFATGATALPSRGSVIYEEKTAGPKSVVQIQEYAGKVNATFSRLTAAHQAQLVDLQKRANIQIADVKSAQLDTLLTRSGLALAIMALASIGLGWVMAGRALRPVRTMNSRARGISERNLHERLALDGPDDELKELGETFDGLLARLEAAFDSQRRFVANASHELRTPITLERALVEVALSDPNASVDSLRETCRRVLVSSEQQERLIDALLTLARSQRGLEQRAPVDLRALTAEVVQSTPSSGIRIDTNLEHACTTGDVAMIERLVANLVENAVRYNEPDGWVTAWTGSRDGEPTLEVTNSGPVVIPEQVEELVKPFSRIDGNGLAVASRTADGREGLGLGLSIVQAIADAHDARLTTTPRPEGGLTVTVSFPAAE
ncbi:MAG TPA: ATP-binding protein [Solirubrobacteraceae bacterium]|nr:ATP-binding protein [Solirubrobacteraceae bacterium]